MPDVMRSSRKWIVTAPSSASYLKGGRGGDSTRYDARMKTLALYNLKGGVGKTAAAVNLASLAAAQGLRTLLWDLDPQGSAAWYLGFDSEDIGGMKRLTRGKTPIGDLIQPTRWPRLHLLAGGLSSRRLEQRVDQDDELLERLAAPLAEDYALLVLDCPAGIQPINDEVLRLADVVATPMIPSSLSVHTFGVLVQHLARQHMRKVRLYPFLSMVDRRRRLHRELVETLPREISTLLRTGIPYASIIEQMGPRRALLQDYAPHSPAALQYQALWAELRNRLGC
jgi:chromosome partitioning protein